MIGKLRDTKGEEAALKQVVQTYVRSIDADAMMRIRELGAEAGEPEQALAYRNLGESIMNIMKEVSEVKDCPSFPSSMIDKRLT